MRVVGFQDIPKVIYLPLWVTKYPRCKDFKSKGEEIYKIDNITENIQCPGLKINQSVAQVDWNDKMRVIGTQDIPKVIQLSLWLSKYPRCKDFESIGGKIQKINNILEIMQHPGLKKIQGVVQVDWNELMRVTGSQIISDMI